MKKLKTEKGITLIALIITIIVMLILVGVSVTVALNGGLFSTAQTATDKTQLELEREQLLSIVLGAIGDDGKVVISELDQDIAADGTFEGTGGTYTSKKSGNKYTVGTNASITLVGTAGGDDTEVTPVAVETDCVGYYVDLGGEEGPEGIVYIDIANTESGSWNGYSYTITNETEGLKEYYVSEEEYTEGPFEPAPVLSLVPGSTGTERFYVMALEDVNPGTYYCWYDAAYDSGISEYATLTKTGVGEGKTNTENMLTAWNATTYGAKDDNGTYDDMWGVVDEGWYIPSKDEWAAFGSTIGVTSSNYDTLGLSNFYWSSSLDNSKDAWGVNFDRDDMSNGNINNFYCVRLGTTF